jgi:hypothetical protein
MLKAIGCSFLVVLSPCLMAHDPTSTTDGLQCTVDGAKVHLEWTAPEKATVESYIVYRNMKKLATVEATGLTYDDSVTKLGRYGYSVFAVTGTGRTGRIKGYSVGACTAKVACFGLTAAVDGLKVTLSWTAPADYTGKYTVARDGTALGDPQAETTLVDTVPAADRYTYTVTTDAGTLIAACKVAVPPTDLQAPTELTCTVSAAVTASLPITWGKICQSSSAVALVWKDPVTYASILISRDGKVIGMVAGDAVSFTDKRVAPGKHTYEVVGVVTGGWKTPAATCEVTVAEPPAPVTDLHCAPKADTSDTVVLTWTLPEAAPYTAIEVFRDGTKIADLTGNTAVSYEDAGLATGKYVYSVVGVTADSASARATCKIKVQAPAAPATFIRGDIDGDGAVDVDDALALLKWVYPGKRKADGKPACMEAADIDNSGAVNLADGIYLIMALYKDGPKPVAPYPECGEAPAPLGCDDPGSCKK